MSLPTLRLEAELQNLVDSPFLLQELGRFISGDHPIEQRTQGCVGVNWLIRESLSTPSKETAHLLWRQYRDLLLMSPNIEWPCLQILTVSLIQLLEQLEEQLNDEILPVFTDLGFSAKVIVYEASLSVESQQRCRLVFIRETIEQYLSSTLIYVREMHCWGKSNPEVHSLELKCLENLAVLVRRLYRDKEYDQFFILLGKLARNTTLFRLIFEELVVQHCSSYQPGDYSMDRVRDIIMYSRSGRELKDKKINRLKAFTFEIFTTLLTTFDITGGVDQFDAFPLLLLMESVMPLACSSLQQLSRDNTEAATHIQMALIQFVERGAHFVFLLNLLATNANMLSLQVIPHLMDSTQLELRNYQEGSDDFLTQIQQLIEATGDERPETVKSYCVELLETLLRMIEGQLVKLVEVSCDSIAVQITGQKPSSLLSLPSKPSVASCFLILSVLSSNFSSRRDLVELIKMRILRLPEINELKGINRAYFLIFLAYNYEVFYLDNQSNGQNLLEMAYHSIDRDGVVLSKCAVLLLKNCITLGFSQNIWMGLLGKIKDTVCVDVINLFLTMVKRVLAKIPADLLTGLIERVMGRVVREAQLGERSKELQQAVGTPILYRCLELFNKITANQVYLREEPPVVDAIWPVFDFFQFSHCIEYESNVLDIFNNLLQADLPFSDAYLSFLPSFLQIYKKNGSFGYLLRTYTLLIENGKQYYETHPQALNTLLESIKCFYDVVRREKSVMYICMLIHYILELFPKMVIPDRDFLELLMKFYGEERETLQSETIAALINLLINWECEFGGVDLAIIEGHTIQIYQDYQGEIFANGVRKLIEKHFASQSVCLFTKYGIRLLHFVTVRHSANRIPVSTYHRPQFQYLRHVDPFNSIRLGLKFLKENIPLQRYDVILEEISKEIVIGEVRDLLSQQLINKTCRKYLKVKAPIE